MNIRVTVWNECRHEKEDEVVRLVYPETIGGAIADGLKSYGFEPTVKTLDDEEQGLPASLLADTDVLIWWGHRYHDEVDDRKVDLVQERVLAGMGLIVLHSGHHAKVFKRLMGTSCNFAWRESDDGECERLWTIQPAHPIADTVPPYVELPKSEMYGEPFDIPAPDEVIFLSWYEGGDVLRSGCVFNRGRGRVFYFSPGHETFPIFRNEHIRRILANAVNYVNQPHASGWRYDHWARPIPVAKGAPEQTLFKKPRGGAKPRSGPNSQKS